MSINTKIFIKIESEDELVLKLQSRIEKSLMLSMWIGKAIALLDRYIFTLDSLEIEADSVKRGILIESIEAQFMSSIILFHRCFVDQPSMHLKINDVTTDPKLRSVYKEIEALRNDEFIHWKGVRSKINVKYSFEFVTPTECKFAENIQGDFSETIGPGIDVKPFRDLFLETSKYVEKKRNEIIEKLRKHISNPEVFMKCKFLNENNESIIKKI